VAKGYLAIAAAEPQRVRQLDATGEVPVIQAAIRAQVGRLLARLKPHTGSAC